MRSDTYDKNRESKIHNSPVIFCVLLSLKSLCATVPLAGIWIHFCRFSYFSLLLLTLSNVERIIDYYLGPS